MRYEIEPKQVEMWVGPDAINKRLTAQLENAISGTESPLCSCLPICKTEPARSRRARTLPQSPKLLKWLVALGIRWAQLRAQDHGADRVLVPESLGVTAFAV
jgi:hypothetical protein